MKYVLIDYIKRAGKITRTLIDVGNPLTTDSPVKLNYPRQFPLASPSGEIITTPQIIRGFNSLLEAKSMAERLTETRTNPVYFQQYDPDQDRYEIRVVRVTKSKDELNLGYPVLGVSHALRTFGFRKDGKIAMIGTVKKRMEIHKADKRIAREKMNAPAI